MKLFDPGEQRAGVVKTDVNGGVSLEDFDKRQIAASVGLFKNMIEIADGLMRVDDENQMELWRHGDWIGLLDYSITRREWF
jgi:hypothetical protein